MGRGARTINPALSPKSARFRRCPLCPRRANTRQNPRFYLRTRIEDELREEEEAEDQATGANPRLISDAIEYDLTTGRPPRRLTSRGDYLYQDDLDPVYKTPLGTMHLQLLPR